MIVRQFLHTDPVVGVSYLFGCASRAAAAVVDPVFDPAFYLRIARDHGMAIKYVIDTHGTLHGRKQGRVGRTFTLRMMVRSLRASSRILTRTWPHPHHRVVQHTPG